MRVRPSLKAQNVKWLVSLAAFDVAVLLAISSPDFTDARHALRTLFVPSLPVLVLILTGMLPSDWKAVLVYWRTRDMLPGCRAFSKHAPADGRIDLAALRKNVGVFPETASDQNAKWFKLYKMVESDTAVSESHKLSLMYRDMAAMSIELAALALVSLVILGSPFSVAFGVAAFFLLQYFVSAICARNSGERLVCNVLAIHSTRKIAATK